MAVRLLAGPFDVVNGEDGIATLHMNLQCNWLPGTGIVSWVWLGRAIITLDGVYQLINTLGQTINCSWWEDCNRLLVMGGDSLEYMFDPKTFVPYLVQTEPVVSSGIGPGNSYVRIRDTRIYTSNWKVNYVTDGVTTVDSVVLPFNAFRIAAGRKSAEVFLSAPYGLPGSKGVFYNTISKTVNSAVFNIGMPCMNLLFAPEFGVLISLHWYGDSPSQIRVWSLEVEPKTVSEPELSKGEIRGGRVVTYRTQVLGDQADACAGELVNWSLSGVGQLLTLQSTVDNDGYAEARVMYRLDETGPSTLQASVTC